MLFGDIFFNRDFIKYINLAFHCFFIRIFNIGVCSSPKVKQRMEYLLYLDTFLMHKTLILLLMLILLLSSSSSYIRHLDVNGIQLHTKAALAHENGSDISHGNNIVAWTDVCSFRLLNS
jgi:hypothetical protein